MDLHEQTVAIAVIGVTGSGKSTFINVASGSELPTHEPVRSGSAELKSATFSLDGQRVILIDTPGFDGGTRNVLEVLKLISDRFFGLYTQGVKLTGVIYMHCVADYMCGASKHNFATFTKFCGDTIQDVLIVTNRWPKKRFTEGEERREEPAGDDEFFSPAIAKGARMLYHDGSRASAHAIIRHLLRLGHSVPSAHGDLSGKMVDVTSASTGPVRELLTGQVEHHTKAFGERIDAATLAEADETKERLQEGTRNSLKEIERTRHDLEQMATGFMTENSLLEEEIRRHKDNSTAQKAETELIIRLLEEERQARKIVEAERQQVKAQLAEERALRERQKIETASLRESVGPTYDKLFACGAVIFVLLCVSRYALESPPLL